ncbi:MAG: dipeptide epimerase [Flavobacterium sp.]
MQVKLHHYNLKLKDNFKISRLSFDIKPSLIVELQIDGYSGYGEATENAYYHLDTFQIAEDILINKAFIESQIGLKPEEFWTKLQPLFKDNLFALCALDEAYHDLYTKKLGVKLYEYWKLQPKNLPLTNYTIGIAEIPKMIEKMKAMPWPLYKIKLGTADDIEIIKALRNETNAIFRVDANSGWTVEETIENAKIFKELGVEFIEQPLKADDWEGCKEVMKFSDLPIIADESCIIEEDIAKCFNHFHGVNIKLMKCGGLTPGLRMIHKAKALGLKTMVGCMTESTVGISAIAHLLPLLDYVDMDGALLLEIDIATGVSIDFGKTTFSKENGTGAKLICQ